MGIVQLVQRRVQSMSDDEVQEIKTMVSSEQVRRIKEKIDALGKLR